MSSTALVRIALARKASLMEYRGIRYTIRAGIQHGQWAVVIHPQGVEVGAKRQVSGSRKDAESHARRMINEWLKLNQGRTESL